MAEQQPNIARFPGGVFRATRPEVLRVLREVSITPFGWWVECRGTPAELIAAGVASEEAFDIGSAGSRKRDDEFANSVTVKRLARGRWDLRIELYELGSGIVPSDEFPGRSAQWKKWGLAAEAATAEILQRFARAVLS